MEHSLQKHNRIENLETKDQTCLKLLWQTIKNKGNGWMEEHFLLKQERKRLKLQPIKDRIRGKRYSG